MTKHKIFSLCFTLIILFVSCSSDNDSNENNTDNSTNSFVEIPSSLLGTYTGGVNESGGLASVGVDNELGTATLIASNSKTYSINFSDNVPSITNIKFVDIGNGTSFIFNDKERKLIIGVETTQTVDILSVIKSSDPIVSFGGGK